MDRTERFYKIDQLINDRKLVPFKDLQDQLEVSRATLKRDLEYMRKMCIRDRLEGAGNTRTPTPASSRMQSITASLSLVRSLRVGRAVLSAVRWIR